MQRIQGLLIASMALMWSGSIAHAHISLEAGGTHKSRSGDGMPFGTTLKSPPCGVAGSVRGTTNVYTYKPGEKITIKWTEYIPHPGHCRIAFAKDGDAFPDPTTATDIKTALPFDLGNGISVLADGIMDPPPGMPFSQEITLPSAECSNCTLQVIQLMTDKPPYEPTTGDDVYHQCIDIVIKGDAMGTGGAMAGTGGAMAGTGGAMAGTGGTMAGTGGTMAGTGGTMAGTGGTSGMGGAGGIISATGGTTVPPTGTGGGIMAPGTKSNAASSGCSATGGRSSASDCGAMLLAMFALIRGRRTA